MEKKTKAQTPVILSMVLISLILSFYFAGCCFMPTNSAGTSNTPKPVGWWKLDEATGKIAQDSSGNNLNGTIIGDPKWLGAGKINGALVLNGSDGYVNLGNRRALNITGAITVAAWVKYDNSDKAWEAIIAKGNNSWRLYRKNGRASNDGADTIFWAVDGLMADHVIGITDIGDQQWHHVAAVYDPDYVNAIGPEGRIFVYIDGAEDNSGPSYGKIKTSKYNVYVGANEEMTDKRHLATVLNGAIDDVRLYNRALGSEAIAEIYSRKR